MLHAKELSKIARWIDQNIVGDFWVSFAQGFEDTYIIIETEKDCREGREVYSLSEILREVE